MMPALLTSDVDAAVPAGEGFDLLAHRGLVGDVERHDVGLAALAGDGARGGFQLLHGAAGAEHRGAGVGQG